MATSVTSDKATIRSSRQAATAGRALAYLGVVGLGVILLRGVDRAGLSQLLAMAVEVVLTILGIRVNRVHSVLHGSGFSMVVLPVCDATDISLLLGTAILVSPVTRRQRVEGLLIALALTQLVNIGRLTTLFVVGLAFLEHFELAHQVLWQVIMMLYAVVFYLIWATRCSRT